VTGSHWKNGNFSETVLYRDVTTGSNRKWCSYMPYM